MIRKLFSEPLVHFLLAALVLFFVVDSVDYESDSDVIRIYASDIEMMQDQWLQQQGRPPNDMELNGLIESAVHRELYYQEGLRLGLDLDDAVVRNRMIQKMKFLQDQGALDPSREQLDAWLVEHKARYPERVEYSFRQIYLGAKVGKKTAQNLASRLNNGALKVSDVGEALLAPSYMSEASLDQISRNFGQDFGDAFEVLGTRKWSGPVQSGFGFHMVNIENKMITPFSLETPEMLQRVRNDWLSAQKEQAELEAIEILVKRYTIEIEGR